MAGYGTPYIQYENELRGITISAWYNGIVIPSFSKRAEISRFVVNSLGLMIAMIKRKYSSLPKVYLSDVPTALIDFDKNEILLSYNYIDPDETKRINPDKNEDETLTALIGTLVHELAHFQHTKISFENAFKLAEIEVSKNNQAIYLIANLVEDLYIDARSYEDFAFLRWAMDCRVSYLFSEERIEECIKLIPTKLNTVDDFTNTINALFCLKNFNLRKSFKMRTEGNKLFATLCEMFLRSLSLNELSDRMKLSKEIFDFMFKDIEMNNENEKEDDSSKNKKDNATGRDSKEKGDLRKEFEELNDPTKEFSIQPAHKEGKEETNKNITVKIEIENFSVSLNKEQIDKPSDAKFIEAKNLIKIKPNSETLVSLGFTPTRVGKQNFKVGEDQRFLEFGALMNAKTNVNRPFGQQSNSGRTIRQLTRILTDQKIFAEPVELQHIGKQSILVLLDCSGSMGGSKIEKAATASVGTVVGLENARHNVCLLGHSADIRINGIGFSDLVLYEFKNFDEPAFVAEERLNTLGSFHQTLVNNSDDNAILNAATYFDKLANPGKKTIIVISDGQPSARNTDGTSTTKNAVDYLRETKGINIVSISIDKIAIRANDTIYGKNNNFFSEDPGVVIGVIEQITGALSF